MYHIRNIVCVLDYITWVIILVWTSRMTIQEEVCLVADGRWKMKWNDKERCLEATYSRGEADIKWNGPGQEIGAKLVRFEALNRRNIHCC